MPLVLIVAGCGRSTPPAEAPPKPVRDVAVARPVTAPPAFVSGGAPGTVGLLCGDTFLRLTAGHESVTLTRGDGWDRAAAHFGEAPEADRFLLRTADGPAWVQQGEARVLPGWPAATPVGVAAVARSGAAVAAAPTDDAPDRGVRIWTLPPAAQPTVLPDELGATVTHLAFDEAGKYLLVADDTGRVAIYQLPDRKPVFTQEFDPATEGAILDVDLSPEGDWFVVSANAVRVRSWRLPFMSAPLAGFGRVHTVFFAGSLEALVTVDEAGSAIRWLLNYGQVKPAASALVDSTLALGHDAAGQALFALRDDGRIRSWRTSDLAELERLPAVLCGGGE
jgi:hypothetical protein